MKKVLAILIVVACVGCASTPRPRETYVISEPFVVIFDTHDNVNRAYQLFTLGQKPNDVVGGFEVNRTVYCRFEDRESFWHELVDHIFKGLDD